MSDDASGPLSAVRTAEDAIRPALEAQLADAVESAPAVERDLRAWGEDVGAADSGAAIRRAAAREANVRTNHVRYRAVVGRGPPADLRSTPVAPYRRLDAVEEADAVLDDLAETLRDRADVDAAALGARYADALSGDERRTRGQFYTPTPVADLVVRWALSQGGCGDGRRLPRVLDPAAGTGTFPLAAFDLLRERHSNAEPSDVLSRLVAVDLDETALHLAALRLSASAGGGSVSALDRRPCSFFDLEPGEDVAPVDAVVGNPPFVRAGELSPDRAHFRQHLESLGQDGASPHGAGGGSGGDGAGHGDGDSGRDGDGDGQSDWSLSRRSDAYVYFVTHATRFLRPGGRLGMVLPAKWLESDYGVGFRRFLADHYRVEAVVGFTARSFDALVDTVLLLAERRERDPACDGGSVRFVRLDERVHADESLAALVDERVDVAASREALNGKGDVGTPRRDVERTGRSRVVRRSQSTFAGARQCSPYLRAPAELLELLDHPGLVPLGDLASVSRGVTTGANGFFLLDPADRDRWGIDDRFLRPAVRSIRGVEARTIDGDSIEQSMLDIHPFLVERLDGGAGDGNGDGRYDADRAKGALRRAGHEGLLAYVRHAEAESVHERRTCRSRRVWFDLGELPAPDAFVPKLVRERLFTVRNRAGAVPTNAIDCVSVRDGVDPGVLLGVLDSSLCRAVMEVWGRDEAGMLQLMTYETRTLPVPDVRTFSASDCRAIREAARSLAADGSGQTALDAAVLGPLGIDLSPARVRSLREQLLRRRVDGGERVDVPVS